MKLVVANWKSNPQTLKEVKRLFNAVKGGLKSIKGMEVVICPPFVYLNLSVLDTDRHNLILKLGAQDCFFQSGPFTGQISPQMLKDLGVEYVIIGHSERRALGETDKLINKKVRAVLEAGLLPILCIGETAEQRKAKKTQEVLNIQLKKDLNHLISQSLNHLTIVYEPVWAISTTNGRAALPEDAKQGALDIKKILTKIFGSDAKKIRILYGGSVDGENVRDFVFGAGMDGVLVGQASLDAKEFTKIVKSVMLG